MEPVERLAGLPLFAEVPRAHLEDVLATEAWEQVPAGSVLMRQGDEGSSLYVVATGQFEVALGEGKSRVAIAVVGPGQLLGEAALFRRSVVRSAEVRALTDAEVLRLDVAGLESLMQRGSAVPRAVETAVLLTLARRIHGSREAIGAMLRSEEAAHRGFFDKLRGFLGR